MGAGSGGRDSCIDLVRSGRGIDSASLLSVRTDMGPLDSLVDERFRPGYAARPGSRIFGGTDKEFPLPVRTLIGAIASFVRGQARLWSLSPDSPGETSFPG